MMELLHATDVPLGLVTNGEEWMLVFAPRGETTGFTSWYASLWIDEPITLRAFHSLLSTRRFFGVAPSDTLLALLKESAQDQQEVTNQLGDQVRDAVEVLIQAFDRLDQDSGRILLKGLDEKSLYDAALTVMMRLVFLFSAEERGLLHLNEQLYDDNYAVSTLREQLQEVADHYGEEVLERRHDGWARLLATFRAVHGGVNHQDLMLPAYGGSLFDPDRYPFLEGRARGTLWQSNPAAPLEINNRVVLHLLKSLQMLQVKVPGGGPAEALRVSFEGLNIEQIGHVYEGLLDHTAVRAKEVVLGLAASRKKPVASMTLAELEKLRQDDEAKLIEVLQEETGRSAKALENVLKNDVDTEDFHKIMVACGQDKKLAERIIRFRGLLRQDSFERLVVVLPGAMYVGQGSERRSTGTHYTPRSLTEPIVQHTLEPLVYQGPAEGLTKEQWRLRSPKEILDLKVCDMAMGSGAFLVQACRYLSERLVEAWENLEKEHPGEVLITPEGGFSQGEPSERLIPKEAAERLAIARRLVADRCLYGVDINPMAVEMAKLSIWLITVDKTRPFTFLDHALKCGDSLLGVNCLEQIDIFSLRPGAQQITFATASLFRYVEEASEKRRDLENLPSNDYAQIETKNRLHAEAEAATAKVKALADCLIALELRGLDGDAYVDERTIAAGHVESAMRKTLPEFQLFAREQMVGRSTFHWPLEFPETFALGGFNAFVGNPPFMGGSKIATELGVAYRDHLVRSIAGGRRGQRGQADLCTYFLCRLVSVVRADGDIGMLATNTISQGDTRIVGLDQLVGNPITIYRAVSSQKWPGAASLEVAALWLRKGNWLAPSVLDGKATNGITPYLVSRGEVTGKPFPLCANKNLSFEGSRIEGQGFVLSPQAAEELIQKEPRNRDVLYEYLRGDDFTSRPDQSPAFWVINFHTWPLNRESGPKGYSGPVAADYPDCLAIVERDVKPQRLSLSPTIPINITTAANWWRYRDVCPALHAALEETKVRRVLFHAFTSKYVAFAFVQCGWVYAAPHNVFIFDGWEHFAVLQSSFHTEWAHSYCSTLETRLRYTRSSIFETYPFPLDPLPLTTIGEDYHQWRSRIMLSREEGLTQTYNRFHDRNEKSEDISRLRELHLEMDRAAASAYGWSDLDLGHAFQETKNGFRYTLNEAKRRTILDRLLTLNHQRYDEEARAGLHAKKANAGSGKRASRKKNTEESTMQGGLYLKTEPLV
jgi:hypothetical protein